MNVFLRNIFIITLYIAGCTNSSKKESVKKNTVKTFSKQKKQVKTKEDEPIYMEYLENDQVVIEASLYRKIIKNELSEIPKFSKMYPVHSISKKHLTPLNMVQNKDKITFTKSMHAIFLCMKTREFRNNKWMN